MAMELGLVYMIYDVVDDDDDDDDDVLYIQALQYNFLHDKVEEHNTPKKDRFVLI